MSNHERRRFVALDDAFEYLRQLETGSEKPQIYVLTNAIRTLDLALSGHHVDSPVPLTLCIEAWTRVRDALFNILVSSFAGRFEVYDHEGAAVEPGNEWPDRGSFRFYPNKIRRRDDSFSTDLQRLSAHVCTVLRWAFADSRQTVEPFEFAVQQDIPADEVLSTTADALAEYYEVCREQAKEGKKKAHRRWWQLYWEATACPNKRQQHQLRKQMVALEGIWGKPSS